METLKVRAKSNPNSVAGALANVFREKGLNDQIVENFGLENYHFVEEGIPNNNEYKVHNNPADREFNINTYARRRAIAEEIMTTLGCSFDKNQVGMFLWGRIPDRYENAEQLTERILHEARVFITPGFIFGSNGERYVRISLCAKENKMREALQRIVQLIHNS